MELLRRYLWVWVICGILFVSVVISLIFLLINKCISRAGKHRVAYLQRKSAFSLESNKYQERNLSGATPPLPPRTQFLTAEAQSYENLAEKIDDYEQSIDEFEQNIDDYEQATPEYEQALPDYEQAMDELHDYEQALPDYEQAMDEPHDYEQATDEPHDYEQAMDEQPDYVKVEEDEVNILPPPPQFMAPDPTGDNTSTEDYDDIGGEDENQGEEDYDDVG